MYKDNRYINAGTTEIYRYGHKAVERAKACLNPNENGFYSIPVNGGRYWTIGTSKGKYGEFAKFGETFFSVNSAGNMWAKVGTEKEQAFIDAVNSMIDYMNKLNADRIHYLEELREEGEEDDI